MKTSFKNETRRERGIALVITLIMLAVTLVMAVAFLAIARRERNASTTATDTAVARLATDAGLAAAQAQIAANILATTNPYNYSLLVSTNYQNGAGFDPAVATVNATNVNYDDLVNNGGALNSAEFIQNIANLQSPASNPSNTAIRAEFRLDAFPPKGGDKKKPATTPATPQTPNK